MKKISLLAIIIYIFSLGFVMAAEGHSHELPEFLHFMEELIEENGILRGSNFWIYPYFNSINWFLYGMEHKPFFKNNIKWCNSWNCRNSFCSYCSRLYCCAS